MKKKIYTYVFRETVPDSTSKLMNTDLCCTITKHHHTIRTVFCVLFLDTLACLIHWLFLFV